MARSTQDKVLFDTREGPWLYIAPIDLADDSIEARWIHETNDKDFHVVKH